MPSASSATLMRFAVPATHAKRSADTIPLLPLEAMRRLAVRLLPVTAAKVTESVVATGWPIATVIAAPVSEIETPVPATRRASMASASC